MTKYYSEEQIRKMFEPPAKMYGFDDVVDTYLDLEFKDVPAIKEDNEEEE